MEKVPTLFERDWAGDRSRVLPVVNPAAAWLLGDRGARATRKRDGTAVRFQHGRLWKRHTVRQGQPAPATFEPAGGADTETGQQPGWVFVSEGPEDRWIRLAAAGVGERREGQTYECCGPRINGNPERLAAHVLLPHGEEELAWDADLAGKTFEGLRAYLERTPIEGVVWWGRRRPAREDQGARPRRPLAAAVITREQFLVVAMEEGWTPAEAEAAWQFKDIRALVCGDTAAIAGDALTLESIRRAIRHYYPQWERARRG